LRAAEAISIQNPFFRWQGPKPAILQLLFVVLFAGFWIVSTNITRTMGRPERALAVLGLLAIPFAAGRKVRVSLALPSIVTVGLVGLLGTYVLSFLANAPDEWGATFVIGLAGRVVFMWIGYVLLQDRMMMHRAFWLLVASSCASTVGAFYVMARYGIGVGRTSGLELNELLGPAVLVVFSSAQMAPVGAVLLLGASSILDKRLRRWVPLLALAIFVAAYFSFFRREIIITLPIVLGMLHLGGARIERRIILVALVGFFGIFLWELSGESSVFGSRMRYEIGGFISPDETRVTTAVAQLEAIADAPIFGYGAGRHAEAIFRYSLITERYLSGFNIYGWLAVEGGVFCLLAYLVILAGVFRAAWRNRSFQGTSPESVVIRCGPALVVQVVLWGAFGNAWEVPLPWFLLGMVLAAVEIARRPAIEPRPHPILMRRAKPASSAMPAPRGVPCTMGLRGGR
jgi:hypothetical protein